MALLTEQERLYQNRGWIKVSDGTRSPSYDTMTHATTTIDYSHHEVHSGSSYFNWVNGTLANGNTAGIAITTPNTTKWLHLLYEVVSTAAGTFSITEGLTSYTGGTTITSHNFNRNVADASGAVVKKGLTGSDPIVPTGGTMIFTEQLGGGKIASTRANGQEIILKENTIYLFQITNGVNANIVSILLDWYEHTNKT